MTAGGKICSSPLSNPATMNLRYIYTVAKRVNVSPRSVVFLLIHRRSPMLGEYQARNLVARGRFSQAKTTTADEIDAIMDSPTAMASRNQSAVSGKSIGSRTQLTVLYYSTYHYSLKIDLSY